MKRHKRYTLLEAAVDKNGMGGDRVAPEKRNDLPPSPFRQSGSIGEGLTMNDLSFANAVSVENGIPATTSIKVAEIFGKDHAKVLRDIRELKCSKEFAEANFGLGSYFDSNQQERPMYAITRDGFSMLAFGFTGEKAMRFKEAYIEAFNAMEKAIKEARSGMISEQSALARSEELIRENERLKFKYEFASHFLPVGNPGDRNVNGEPKTRYRRGYYCAGNGRSITALVERDNQPGLFDEIELKQICATREAK